MEVHLKNWILINDFGERIAGEEIAVFGFPFGSHLKHPSLTKGIISALFTDPKNNVDMIQTDTWIYESSSGSPIFLIDEPKVIGYATSSLDPFVDIKKPSGFQVIGYDGKTLQDRTNICFALPSKYILELLETLWRG